MYYVALLDEMPQLLELSYQTILLTWISVLLANCPHEEECVDIGLHSVVLCLQVGPCVSAQAHLVDLCNSGDCAIDSTIS